MLTKHEIPTPALLLDMDVFESNLTLMAHQIERCGKNLRPHAKAHKCVEIARRQIATGAIGVCAATVPEAELMTSSGITGVLLTSPLADPLKIARIVQTGAMVALDHVQQAAWYQEAASAANRVMDVLVDIDVGDHRTGASSIQQALDVAQAVDRATHLQLRGLQAYSPRSAHGANVEERKRTSEAAFQIAIETRAALSRIGLEAAILTGGSTGTWNIDTHIPEVTELQAGSYVLMDIEYGRIGVPFQQALTVLATVVSVNHDAFVTVDAGFKAFSTDRPFGPEAIGQRGSSYRWGGDEFGYFDCPNAKPRLGDRIEFIPPHCDPTVNLHDRIYVCRGEKIEAVWPVMGRRIN